MRQWNLLRLREELRAPRHHPGDLHVRGRGRHPDPPQDELPAHPRRPGRRRRRLGRRPARLPRPPQLADADEHPVLPRDLGPRPRRRLPDQAPEHHPLRQPLGDPLERPLGSVRKAVKATADDAVVVVWGPAGDVKTGVQEIAIRAREATVGIPSETRQALRDGTNGFERILPGRGPDVSRHRPASQAGHRGAPRAHPPGAARPDLDARGLVPRARPARRCRRAAGRFAAGRPFRGPGQGLEDRTRGRGGGPRPVPQAAEKEGLGPERPDRRDPPQDLRPVSATGGSPGTASSP